MDMDVRVGGRTETRPVAREVIVADGYAPVLEPKTNRGEAFVSTFDGTCVIYRTDGMERIRDYLHSLPHLPKLSPRESLAGARAAHSKEPSVETAKALEMACADWYGVTSNERAAAYEEWADLATKARE